MKYYADTGFLLSLHIPETTSAAAVAMSGVSEPLPVSRLLALEFRNALRLAVFRQAYARALGRTEFLSFDKRQRRLATAAGLNVLPEPLILI